MCQFGSVNREKQWAFVNAVTSFQFHKMSGNSTLADSVLVFFFLRRIVLHVMFSNLKCSDLQEIIHCYCSSDSHPACGDTILIRELPPSVSQGFQ